MTARPWRETFLALMAHLRARGWTCSFILRGNVLSIPEMRLCPAVLTHHNDNRPQQ